MRDPYWHDATATLYAGHPRELLAEMPDHAVDCLVTAPPAWTPDIGPTQAHQKLASYGHEPTPALYVAALRRVLAEAHRVLADEGTCWLITGGRYAGPSGRPAAGPPVGRHARRIRDHAMTGLPATTLIGLPWQLAFALQDDGWIIRNAIIWHHPDAPTETATDRLPTIYELTSCWSNNGGTTSTSTPSAKRSTAPRWPPTRPPWAAPKRRQAAWAPAPAAAPAGGTPAGTAAESTALPPRTAGAGTARQCCQPGSGMPPPTRPAEIPAMSGPSRHRRPAVPSRSNCRCGVLPPGAVPAGPCWTPSLGAPPSGWPPGNSAARSSASLPTPRRASRPKPGCPGSKAEGRNDRAEAAKRAREH